MIRRRRVEHALGQFAARGFRVARLDQELREERAHAVHAGVAFEHFAHELDRRDGVAAAARHDGAEGLDERVVRLHLRAEVEFGERVVVARLVHQHARAVVAHDDAFRRVHLEHPAEAFERVVVATVEARERGRDELHAHVVRRLGAHQLDPRARLLLLAARQIDEDHVEPRLQQLRVERERLLESLLGALVVFGAAEALDDAVGVGAAQSAVREREVGVEFDGALEVFDGLFRVLARERVVDEAPARVAPAQVLFVGGGAGGGARGGGGVRRGAVNAEFLRDGLVDGFLGLGLDAAHQLAEARVVVQRAPVRVGLEPRAVLVAEVDGALQPLEGFFRFAEHGVGGGEPVGDVVVGAGRVADAVVELRARFVAVALPDEHLREDGADAVHRRVLVEHFAQESRRLVHVALAPDDDGAEGLDERVVGLNLRAVFEFEERVVEAVLVHHHARAVVAGDDARRRVETRQTVEGAQRAVVFAVEPVERALDEVDGGLVRRLARQVRHLVARLALLAAREVDEDHQDARLDHVGVEFERALEGVLRQLVVLRAAQPLETRLAKQAPSPLCASAKPWSSWMARWKCAMARSHSSGSSVPKRNLAK